jgi:hypothetical protein
MNGPLPIQTSLTLEIDCVEICHRVLIQSRDKHARRATARSRASMNRSTRRTGIEDDKDIRITIRRIVEAAIRIDVAGLAFNGWRRVAAAARAPDGEDDMRRQGCA